MRIENIKDDEIKAIQVYGFLVCLKYAPKLVFPCFFLCIIISIIGILMYAGEVTIWEIVPTAIVIWLAGILVKQDLNNKDSQTEENTFLVEDVICYYVKL